MLPTLSVFLTLICYIHLYHLRMISWILFKPGTGLMRAWFIETVWQKPFVCVCCCVGVLHVCLCVCACPPLGHKKQVA